MPKTYAVFHNPYLLQAITADFFFNERFTLLTDCVLSMKKCQLYGIVYPVSQMGTRVQRTGIDMAL